MLANTPFSKINVQKKIQWLSLWLSDIINVKNLYIILFVLTLMSLFLFFGLIVAWFFECSKYVNFISPIVIFLSAMIASTVALLHIKSLIDETKNDKLLSELSVLHNSIMTIVKHKNKIEYYHKQMINKGDFSTKVNRLFFDSFEKLFQLVEDKKLLVQLDNRMLQDVFKISDNMFFILVMFECQLPKKKLSIPKDLEAKDFHKDMGLMVEETIHLFESFHGNLKELFRIKTDSRKKIAKNNPHYLGQTEDRTQ